MRTIRKLAAILAVAAALALVTGCTELPDKHATAPASLTATSRPTPTPILVPNGPATMKAAASASDAIAAANQTLLGYLRASFDSGHAGGTELATVEPWTTGAALANEQTLAGYLRQKHLRLDGTPTGWTLDTARSTAAPSVTASGQRLAYGVVQLRGCATSTNHPVGTGAPAWITQGKQFARQWTVLYAVDRHVWLVSRSTDLTVSSGGTSCG